MQVTRSVHLILGATLSLFFGACDHDEDISAADRADDDELAENIVVEEEAGEISLQPISTLTLANGNVLEFYATADGWTGVHEYPSAPASVSLIEMLGEDVTPAEVWRIAAAEGEEMPLPLLRASLIAGAIQEGQSHGLGGAESIVAVSDPSASSTWCDGVGDDDASFDNWWCGVYGGHGSAHADYWCAINNAMGPGTNYSKASDPALHVVGAWCLKGGSTTFTSRWMPSGGGAWTYTNNNVFALEGQFNYHHPTNLAIYEFKRSSSSWSYANWGMSWKDTL